MKRLVRWTVVCMAAGCLFAGCSDDEEVIRAEALRIDPDAVTLRVGESLRLEATVTPADAEDGLVVWSSDRESVATVDEGTVRAVSVGTARITAKAGGVSAVCTVTVEPVAVESVTLDSTELTLKVGDTKRIEATVLPEDASDRTVAWSSTDEGVATVTKGVVTALSPGKTTVVARAGGVEGRCEVVVDPIAVESVTLDPTELTLKVGDTKRIEATVLPEDATDRTVVWSSTDEDVATVAEGVVTALSPGRTTVVARAGGIEGRCEVTVDPIAVESVTLDEHTLSLMEGETHRLTATVLPDNATDRTVAWSSSDEGVVTVSDGLVTAVAAGAATITALAGDRTDACEVTVVSAGRSWAVGDLYEEDGVRGVVFSVSADGRSGKIVSLDQSVKLWATGPYEARAYDEQDGKANTEKIKELGLPMTSFPACAWCIDHGEGWYMPAIDELQGFLRVKAEIDATLKANGGTEISGYDWYWSSTEGEDSEGTSAICGYITSGGVGSYGEWKDQPEDDTYVRAVYAF